MTAICVEQPEDETPREAPLARPRRADGRLIAMLRASRDVPTYPATSPEKARLLRAICERHPGCTIYTHQQRMLEAMSAVGSVTVVECRELLGLSNPPQTARTLMANAITVHSTPVVYKDKEGNMRRTSAYSLGAHD